MNRIVIVGNGFDLHNNLETGYKEFIRWYIEKHLRLAINKNIENANLTIGAIKYINISYNNDNLKKLSQIILKDRNDIRLTGLKFEIKGQILTKTLADIARYGWADIEKIYYDKLTLCLAMSNNIKKERYINLINEELLDLRNNLVEYLESITIGNNMYFRILGNERLDERDYRQKHLQNVLRTAGQTASRSYYYYKKTIFVNFNYTNYWQKELMNSFKLGHGVDVINIHGELNSNGQNVPFFGYGDDQDEKYRELENITISDEWNRFFKTVYYQNTDNYKSIIDYLDSEQFQVIIAGHSCSLSDKTLLKTIFEHNNCLSIKPYYYKYKDEETGKEKDNWHSLMTNISRIFTNKEKMREIVVSKRYRSNEERNLFFDQL